ncbi:MAG: hypothetical protein V1799_07895 [bacterium]
MIGSSQRLVRRGGIGSGGKRDDIGFYVRSTWEANVVRYYRFRKIKFRYEPKEFEFVGLKRGIRFYKPDFYLPEEGVYVEVKGYLDRQSLTKLKRFLKYFPEEAKRLRIMINRVWLPRKMSYTKEASALMEIGYKVSHLESYGAIAEAFCFIEHWEK